MDAVGRDGTFDFEAAHAWVNIEEKLGADACLGDLGAVVSAVSDAASGPDETAGAATGGAAESASDALVAAAAAAVDEEEATDELAERKIAAAAAAAEAASATSEDIPAGEARSDVGAPDPTVHADSDRITMAQVARHSSPSDAWTVVRGRVYDITDFPPEHPGGVVVLDVAGKDGTAAFDAMHAHVDPRQILPESSFLGLLAD